ncbi:phosphopantothenoylcysteine decarboxylase-like [Primulina huaijiensis]|uniref:phosphopantothenoylcysteine decarboxylase-like n=1 Tax=Primulina huaijiensis TaxID=1492673 RepID=UPI003CC72905
MAHPQLANAGKKPLQINKITRRPRVLLAACGSVTAVKFAILCQQFHQWAEIKAVVTQASLYFTDMKAFPRDVPLYTDEHEWSNWKKKGDTVLHIELREWADIMVIAPLSANTLAKIAGGLCDNLLTSIVRAWDYTKPIFVAPSMNASMWTLSITEEQLKSIDELGISCIRENNGVMADIHNINYSVRLFVGT